MINKKLFFTLISALMAVTLFLASCEDNVYTINSKKLAREEQELLAEYLELHLDSLKEVAIETKDNLPSTLLFFKMKAGTGDSAKVGKTVGYRYTMYQLSRDSLDVPTLYYAGSNEYDTAPAEYQVGTISPYSSVYSGLDEGIQYMRRGDKVKLIIPSGLWSNDFVTRVMDVELTYVER